MRMLRRNLICRSIRAAKHHRDFELATRHVMHRCCMIYDLVGGQYGEIPGHELNNGPKASHRRSNTNGCKAQFGNGSVYHSFVSELFPKPTGYLVSTIVLGNFFAHHENVFVSNDLFAKSLI